MEKRMARKKVAKRAAGEETELIIAGIQGKENKKFYRLAKPLSDRKRWPFLLNHTKEFLLFLFTEHSQEWMCSENQNTIKIILI